jgi:KUP system potassium uptake protein
MRPDAPGARQGRDGCAHARGAGRGVRDIGTSPLYALQTVFTHDNHAVPTTDSAVSGVVSLVFWTITLIVSVKYVTFIMRADNEARAGSWPSSSGRRCSRATA